MYFPKISSWWHRVWRKHSQVRRSVTRPIADPSRGILIKCSCGEMWAL
ncbi:hypothetical protein SEA_BRUTONGASTER_123 [Gordonia phage BrutonGaster]|uniref:Uncharacterized protein n=1 Tax=Gordonia phage BrutonGaster TaxID=2530116 RepID=A0A482JHB6_9CAUD|nr:hypothetical protein HOV26_gp059 [Gordonia phage BrutonGaster]QBP33338.1 hypothetical protein SEA_BRUTONGASTER_123 [Gordonia phage BrutonGaster]